MRSLGNLLEKRQKSLKASFDDKDVFYVFSRVIGEEFGSIGKEKFRPDFFKNKTLFIKCSSPTWAGELWLNKEKIIKKINEQLGDNAVERIKTK